MLTGLTVIISQYIQISIISQEEKKNDLEGGTSDTET